MEYPEPIRSKLSQLGIEIGDKIRLVREDGLIIEGILMPRPRGANFIVVKLRNGYNVGIAWDKVKEITLIEKKKRYEVAKAKGVPKREGLPTVKIIGTGGTIASKIDYETGAVKPAMSAEELVEDIPELLDVANIEAEQILEILSENMEPKYWEKIALAVHAELLRDEIAGVIVAHGTDTMAYTSSALAFAIQDLNKPVVFTGAQRSSDRPSSDAAFNLMASVVFATKANAAEVVVTMHGETGDTYAVVHRATRVRKFHSTRRDAFQSVCAEPLAYVWPWAYEVKMISEPLNRRSNIEPKVLPKFDPRVLQVKAYPGMPDLLEIALEKGYRGVIIEGTGMGHVPQRLVETIKRLTDAGVFVGVTTQCIHGTVNLNVYSTGREMLDAGAVPLEDMLAEVATVKLMWALGNYGNDLEKVREIMLKPIAGEIRNRRTINLYRLSYPEI
ncbi:glutamyl-tRNA(Gln) amidotransferase [Ignicoccus pacificus DSM 13166]|uniref:Glutamyl-tRNA(Gln) amidotransferase subunit D n=1 Tax=Ignicoccus pacificus DSM 13166 TaxID=940294 RepID=A0A977KBQ7_9CREN|nr:glutamyl-tRNA(Gln) amidotransferase [Ignicoccus pacificus DSM 13166]